MAKRLRDVEPAKAESGYERDSHGHKRFLSHSQRQTYNKMQVFSLGKSFTIEFPENSYNNTKIQDDHDSGTGEDKEPSIDENQTDPEADADGDKDSANGPSEDPDNQTEEEELETKSEAEEETIEEKSPEENGTASTSLLPKTLIRHINNIYVFNILFK